MKKGDDKPLTAMGVASRITDWYFSHHALPHWCVLLLDTLVTYCSAWLIYAVNYGITSLREHFWMIALVLGIYALCYVPAMLIFRTYSGILRYSSFIDLQRIATVMITGALICLGVRTLFNFNQLLLPIRLRDILEWTIMALTLMWGLRVMVKYVFDMFYRMPLAERCFIYGVRNGGISIAKSINNEEPSQYVIAGFVTDDDDGFDGSMLMGKHVYESGPGLARKMLGKGADILFVSPSRAKQLPRRPEMVYALITAGIKIRVYGTDAPWDGETPIQPGQMREVAIEDLLPRRQIEVDMDAIGRRLEDRTVLITGAAGSIGSEIVRQVAMFSPRQMLLIDQAETPLHDLRLMMADRFPKVNAMTVVADITNRHRMEELIRETRPDYVFHAAAYKHVPMMEDNPSESIVNNVMGTRIMADLAVKYGVEKFVMVSTDKAVNPTNVMGASKRLCEIYVQSLDRAVTSGRVSGKTRFVTTRFGNVLGSNGSVIPLFREQIRRGGPVTVTHPDIIRYFMLIPEACSLVLTAGTMGDGGEIFVFDMGEPVKIADLARRMIALSGKRGIKIEYTGLRDGEKLYEELLDDRETTIPWNHPQIKVARVRLYDYDDVCREFDCLVDACRDGSTDMDIVRRMKEIVPEFRSRHSVYCSLDKELA